MDWWSIGLMECWIIEVLEIPLVQSIDPSISGDGVSLCTRNCELVWRLAGAARAV
jgi:hypothetical protein